MFKFRFYYFLLFIALFGIEICIAKFFVGGFIRENLGDFLVVILIYCFVRSFFNVNPLPAAIFVLLFSYTVEYLQYLKIIERLGLQHNRLARVIIGTSFSWADILAYSLGIGLVILAEQLLLNRTGKDNQE